MTWLIRCGVTPGVPSTASIAATIPDVMSAVPGTLALAITRSAASIITASVLVPPTSTPRRQSGGGTGELLHGQAVELVAERARPGDRDSLPGPPDRVAAEGDHGDPLAVGDPLGRARARSGERTWWPTARARAPAFPSPVRQTGSQRKAITVTRWP